MPRTLPPLPLPLSAFFLRIDTDLPCKMVLCSVVDNDGEFLLVEAAIHLPNWLKPETAIHRVWLAQSGSFHIIPITLVPQLGSTHHESILKALDTVSSQPTKTRVPLNVEKCIQERIDAAVSSNVPHWTACTLPVNAAFLLNQRPEWIAKAVSSFYHRDPISLRTAQNFPRFGVSPKVHTMIRFSRCLYAQISSQHWIPPRSYGMPMQPSANTSNLVQNVAFEIGSRVACGLEIFYQQEMARNLKMSSVQAMNTYPFTKDVEWTHYARKLKSIGYFRGLPETSLKYAELEKRAKQKFLTMHPQKALSVLPTSLATEFDQLLGNFDQSPELSERITQERVAMFPDSALFPSSSTAWMNISPEEVDRILYERQQEQEQVFRGHMSSSSGVSTSVGSKGRASGSRDSVNEHEGRGGRGSVHLEDEDEEEMNRAPDLFDKMVKDIERFLVMKSGVDGVEIEQVGDESAKKPQRGDGATVEDTDDSDEDGFYDTDSDEDRVDLEDLEEGEVGEGAEGSLDVDPALLKAERTTMLELMREMDAQLLDTELSKSFAKSRSTDKAGNDDDDDDSQLDVDANLNLVKNFIESYASQHGVAGPVSTLLGQLHDWNKRQTSESV